MYSSDDVRGFNPVDAGNARIEGLYFDQIDRLPGRIVDASRIRVGLSTQGFAFPAPTGLVDYRLTKPGSRAEGSFEIQTEGFLGPGFSIEGMMPLTGAQLGISGGVGGRYFRHSEGGGHYAYNYGATLTYRPFAGAEWSAFGGEIRSREEEARPTVFPAGSFVPPRVPRQMNLRQPWSDRETNNATLGTIALIPFGEMRVEAGLFHTRRATLTSFADIMAGVSENGSVLRRTIVADVNNIDRSTSGELRIVRQWSSGSLSHRLMASLRGRIKERSFGGSQQLLLGASSILEPDPRPQPRLSPGPKNWDDVTQVSGGIAYSLVWGERAALDLGLSKSSYRKRVDFADASVVDPVTRDNPLTWNVFAAYSIDPNIRVFAGVTRGQEEALIAPATAINRSEAPPAIRTSQFEGGIRVTLGAKLTLMAGVFSISKPYFNLDLNQRYRRLGDVSNRGIEVSLTGEIVPGLTIVGGTVLTDPRISGDLVDSGVIGRLPVGQVRRRSVANLEWRGQRGTGALSVDLKLENVSSRVANTRNTFFAPGFTTVDVGGRYRFSVGDVPLVLRAELMNVLNSYGWRVSPSGGFTYSNPRTLAFSLIGDF